MFSFIQGQWEALRGLLMRGLQGLLQTNGQNKKRMIAAIGHNVTMVIFSLRPNWKLKAIFRRINTDLHYSCTDSHTSKLNMAYFT